MSKYAAVLCAGLVLIINLMLMLVYLVTCLGGDINFHILSSNFFGVPSDLATRGVETLFCNKKTLGWDGQFYYYMSNDILGLKDTSSHIDHASYRYQRIGLSLYTAIIAKLLLQPWVSPFLFYISYLALVIAAVWAAARVFQERGDFASAGLLWALSVGTQIALSSALPDAAADAFLILATWSIFRSYHLLGVLLLAMAALSRESYIVFPAAYLACSVWNQVVGFPLQLWPSKILNLFKNKSFLYFLIPLMVFFIWQLYITLHFKQAPMEGVTGILGWPLQAWWKGVVSGLSGSHYSAMPGSHSYFEAACSLFFMFLLLSTFSLSVVILRKGGTHTWIRALAMGGIVLVLIYVCFGQTVAMHYSGYMKASSLFLFLIPLFLVETVASTKRQLAMFGLLLSAAIMMSSVMWSVRFIHGHGWIDARYTRIGEVTNTDQRVCLKSFDAKIRLVGVERISNSFSLKALLTLFCGVREVLWVELTNNSGQPFEAFHGKGSVHMSYQWYEKGNQSKVHIDGVRSMMVEGVPDGGTVRVPVVVKYPRKVGDYILRLSLVQEECAWFHSVAPASALEIEYKIR